MSRIARPIHLSGGESTIQDPTILRTTRLGSPLSTHKKQSRFSGPLPQSSGIDDTTSPAAADAPKLQRRSLKSSTANGGGAVSRSLKKPAATVRSSVSSTDELSEPESLAFIPPSKDSGPEPASAHTLAVGNRVFVPGLGVHGTLRFLGPTSFKTGTWAGIELDVVGSGKNDGCVQGIRYFSCPPQTGLFILDSKVSPAQSSAATTAPAPASAPALDPTTKAAPPTDKPMNPSAKALRSSKQPLPERTRSSVYTRRSKSLASPSAQKLTPSKTLTTRSSTTEKRPSRFSLGAAKHAEPPVPPLPKSVAGHPAPPASGTNSTENSTSIDINESTALQTAPEPVAAVSAQDAVTTTDTTTTTATTTATTQTTKDEEPATTSSIVSKEELYQIYDLLEKARDEKEKLVADMSNKEAAWERLVSTKESYALQVQEKEEAMTRLQHQLDDMREQCAQLELQIQDKDAALAKNVKDEGVHEQYQKRIEKLEGLVEELNSKSADTAGSHKAELDLYVSKLDQMQHALSDQETMTATLEKECEELRRAGLEAIRAYEVSVQELKQQKEELSQEKETEVSNLNRVIEDLRQRSIAMGVLDVDEELGYRDTYADEWHDQRQRLEEQLELAMTELEQERLRVQTLTIEVDKLQKELQRLHMDSSASDNRYQTLQQELEQEVRDKRRLMEEADAAFEAQARAEDENYQMKMARVKMERELAEAHETIKQLRSTTSNGNNSTGSNDSSQSTEPDSQSDDLRQRLDDAEQAKIVLEKECQQLRHANKDMEQECIRLMDEMLALEKADGTADSAAADAGKETNDTPHLRAKITHLERQLLDERQRFNDLELAKHTEINHLNKELAELETLVESRVFGEADMEQALDAERRRVRELENELRALQDQNTAPPPAATAVKTRLQRYDVSTDPDQPYCDICETHGHDVISCTALLTTDSKKHAHVVYCENCDHHNIHSTEDCPNQDEVF